jgi:hypothetical protein
VDELLLDFSMEADELPMDVDDALDADDVLSACAARAARANASARNKGRVAFRKCCMDVAWKCVQIVV